MLKHLAIENFKCYEGRYEFNFPGLTYLTGANNSGKSTVIQALYMLAKSNTRNADASLLLNTDSYHFGNYTNVLNKNCSNKDNIIFDIEYDKFSLQAEYDRNENVNFNPVLKYLEVDFFPTKNCKSCLCQAGFLQAIASKILSPNSLYKQAHTHILLRAARTRTYTYFFAAS